MCGSGLAFTVSQPPNRDRVSVRWQGMGASRPKLLRLSAGPRDHRRDFDERALGAMVGDPPAGFARQAARGGDSREGGAPRTCSRRLACRMGLVVRLGAIGQNCANVDGNGGVSRINGIPKSVTCVFSIGQIGSTPPASTTISCSPICTVTRVTVQLVHDHGLPPQGTQADVRKGPSSPH